MRSIKMEVNYQNIQEEIQGNWLCTKSFDQTEKKSIDLDFSLLIAKNIISRTGAGARYWPNIASFELVGSNKDGYFYREDGCFMQVKTIANNEMVIELFLKDSRGQLNTVIFTFEKELY
ncbi:hypothetical protein [uncultured Marivirga sp.]|uniref:hypothetical protein n=1 Tax=uncultured Marivirga sp. TaxID=1123707 RepID=UPI0030EE9472